MIQDLNIDKSIYYIQFDKFNNTLSGDTVIKVYKDNADNYTFNPDFQAITIDTILIIIFRQNINIYFDGSLVEDGNYTNNVSITNDYNVDDFVNFQIQVKVFNSGGIIPEPPIVYDEAKYTLENTNIAGDVYRTEIWDKNYSGTTTYIRGYSQHKYVERKDLLYSVISSNLDITLEANQDITLQDLYTEDEGVFTAKLFRNNELIFFGLLKPDGIIEDFVSDEWEISMDAMDGLNILKDLSFVKDNGGFYDGKISQFDAVFQCLHRIGFDLPLNISINFNYDDHISNGSVLKDVLMNADRFYQDKTNDKIMSCEEVLKSVLDIYRATIIQMNGEWWIFKPNDVQSLMTFNRYEGSTYTGDINFNPTLNIGSQKDDFAIHHINSNQQKSINPTTQAFKLNYKYGTVKAISRNPNLQMASGISLDGWIVDFDGLGYIYRRDIGSGFYIKREVLSRIELIRSNQTLAVTLGDNLNVSFRFNHVEQNLAYPLARRDMKLSFRFRTTNFILSDSGWVNIAGNTGIVLDRNYNSSITNVTETFNFWVPETGNLQIYVFLEKLQNYNPNPIPPPNPLLEFYSIQIVPSMEQNYKGEYHTAQRKTRISSVTKTDTTVNNGDSISDIYLGTLYGNTGLPTTRWGRGSETPNKELLRLMVEDTLRIAPRPMIQFDGDVYGYFPFLSLVYINNVSGKFQISKYNFNTNTNINRCNFKEFSTDFLIEDVDYTYERGIDYGNEVKVLINP